MVAAGSNSRLQRLCDALRSFFGYTGHWDEWVQLSMQAESKPVAAGDLLAAGERALAVGKIHESGKKQQVYWSGALIL
jgi:hypothetical protein